MFNKIIFKTMFRNSTTIIEINMVLLFMSEITQ